MRPGLAYADRHANPINQEIRIIDSGPGITEGIRERVLDPFFTTKEVGKARGEGLSIAHAVVTNLHQESHAREATPVDDLRHPSAPATAA